MKKILFAFIALAVVFTMACKKKSDDDPQPVPEPHEKHDIIVSHYWLKNYQSLSDGGNWYPQYPDSCDADDRYYFQPSGVVLIDPYLEDCGRQKDSSLTWSLINKETDLMYHTTQYNIASFSTSRILLRRSLANPGGGSVVDTLIFVYP